MAISPFIRHDLPRKSSSAFTYYLIPEGIHSGRIIAVVDLGRQRGRNGDEAEQIVLGVELTQRRPDGSPWTILERFRYSLRPSSKLYKCLASLVGSTAVDAPNFDLASILGKPCRVEVKHTYLQAKDRSYHNIESFSKYTDEGVLPQSVIKPFSWSVKQDGPIPAVLEDPRLPLLYGRSLKAWAEDSHERRERFKDAHTYQENDSDLPF